MKFQSAPAIAGGRCQAAGLPWHRHTCFNPRPPLLAGDATRLPTSPTPSLFQSAPAIAGGRCRCRPRCPASTSGFNPRPPLLAGDAAVITLLADLQGVSIRARHCWRAMPPRSNSRCRRWPFQSAPAIAGGRCLSSGSLLLSANCFNPRPPLLAGDAFAVGPPVKSLDGFNPRPPLLAGDACWHMSGADHENCFNPRPPLLAGDAEINRAYCQSIGVSIRARHCWRAMQGCSRVPPQPNPVSIRARHCWRAMRRAYWISTESDMFQSAPAIAGGRCSGVPACTSRRSCFNPRPPLLAGDAWRAPWLMRTPRLFQSAPAIAGGRCGERRSSHRHLQRFNPRPPLLAGDAGAERREARCRPVSIRARHCWRAMQGILRAARRQQSVSIRARHCWRAMLVALTGASTFTFVSIRARHCWRAMRTHSRACAQITKFQSAPAIAGGRCRAKCGAKQQLARSFNPRPPLLAGDAHVTPP